MPDDRNGFYEFNKRNEFSTIWDDKKLLEKQYLNNNNNNNYKTENHLNNKITTNVLPTTNSSYGNYNNYNNKIFNY